jgi:outer membrane beta-barrel protein
MRNLLLCWFGGLLLGGVFSAPSPALAAGSAREAEESAAGAEADSETRLGTEPARSRTLAERIPSVTRRSFQKTGRVELTPSVGMSLNDPFYDHVIFEAALTYHALEWLAVSGVGDYFLTTNADVPVAGGAAQQHPNVDHPTYSGRLELLFSPLYGKLSLFAESVIHFDAYLIAGGGLVGLSRTGSAPVGVVGLGQHFFFQKWLALRIELRDQLFTMSRNAAAPTKGKGLQNLLTANLGFCFYLPTDFEYEAL